MKKCSTRYKSKERIKNGRFKKDISSLFWHFGAVIPPKLNLKNREIKNCLIYRRWRNRSVIWEAIFKTSWSRSISHSKMWLSMLKIRINMNTVSRKEEHCSSIFRRGRPTILLSRLDLRLWRLPFKTTLNWQNHKNCWTMLYSWLRKILPSTQQWDSMQRSSPNSKKKN